MRTINISAGHLAAGQVDSDKWMQLHEQCGSTDEPIRTALGYLSLWNWSSFTHVDIVLMGEPGEMELLASYRKEAGGRAGYTIGAVWHDDHWGFHS